DLERCLEQHEIQGTKVTALEAIYHVTEHFSMHTGQIILLTKMGVAHESPQECYQRFIVQDTRAVRPVGWFGHASVEVGVV
ncbi:MAG: hypothetical protein ACR2HX_00610, partial [Pyrinomonadaceae bacterium]